MVARRGRKVERMDLRDDEILMGFLWKAWKVLWVTEEMEKRLNMRKSRK